MLEDATASINYRKITKQFYWKDISNKVVRMRHMLRFPYLPASIFHSIAVATMSENEGVNHSVHTQNFVLLKSQRETGPVNGILYDGQHLYLQQRKLFASKIVVCGIFRWFFHNTFKHDWINKNTRYYLSPAFGSNTYTNHTDHKRCAKRQ